MAQAYEQSHGSIENAWIMVVSRGGFDRMLLQPVALAGAAKNRRIW
jgi:hypothetical protein